MEKRRNNAARSARQHPYPPTARYHHRPTSDRIFNDLTAHAHNAPSAQVSPTSSSSPPVSDNRCSCPPWLFRLKSHRRRSTCRHQSLALTADTAARGQVRLVAFAVDTAVCAALPGRRDPPVNGVDRRHITVRRPS